MSSISSLALERSPTDRSALELFAVAAPGLASITSAELRALGMVPSVTDHAGVAWSGTLDDVYIANLSLRTASRVLVRVAHFRATTFFELERKGRRVPWERYVSRDSVVTFRVTCRKSRLYHSDAVAQRLAEAVGRRTGASVAVPSERGTGPVAGDRGDLEGPDDRSIQQIQHFVVRVDHDTVSISADTSGALLHRRGYRLALAKAPVRETLAAAMLLASGWDSRAPLLDPMCGSGTIAIEAALLARRRPPGWNRAFAFMAWPDFDQPRWRSVLDHARALELPRAPVPIRASDRDAGAVHAALANTERAGVLSDIELSQRSISAVSPSRDLPEVGWIVTNPPYGVRVGDHTVRDLYAQFGKVIRTNFPHWHVGLLSADYALARQLRIPLVQAFETSNGGIPVRFMLGAT